MSQIHRIKEVSCVVAQRIKGREALSAILVGLVISLVLIESPYYGPGFSRIDLLSQWAVAFGSLWALSSALVFLILLPPTQPGRVI